MNTAKWHFLDLFFNPASVAVVGATRDASRINFSLVGNLVKLKFPGRIYPVNPNVQEVLGLPTYPSLKDIEGSVDLVVSAVSAASTLEVVKDCVAKGVKGVVLVSGGFSEIGEKGKRMQDEIARLLREAGIRAIGPNALSPINTANNLAISFYSHQGLRRGNLSFVFQSGMYEPRMGWLFSDFHLGISKLIDLGNKMDINEVDALEYLGSDPDTEVIAMHLESVAGDSRRFVELLRNTSKKKPMVVLKTGRTPAGAKAAQSHSGALMQASDAVFEAALRQSGAIRAQGLEEFFDFAKAFSFLSPPKGNRIAVATLAGGEGVVAADSCQYHGLSLAELGAKSWHRLRKVFPPWDIPLNPFDLGVSAQFHPRDEVHRAWLKAAVSDRRVDGMAIHLVRGRSKDWEGLLQLFLEARRSQKPLATWVCGVFGEESAIVERLESKRIPVYPSAERAIRALSALHRYSAMQKKTR